MWKLNICKFRNRHLSKEIRLYIHNIQTCQNRSKVSCLNCEPVSRIFKCVANASLDDHGLGEDLMDQDDGWPCIIIPRVRMANRCGNNTTCGSCLSCCPSLPRLGAWRRPLTRVPGQNWCWSDWLYVATAGGNTRRPEIGERYSPSLIWQLVVNHHFHLWSRSG